MDLPVKSLEFCITGFFFWRSEVFLRYYKNFWEVNFFLPTFRENKHLKMHVIPHLPLQRGQSTPSQKTIKVKNHSLLSPKHVLDATDGSDHRYLVTWPSLAKPNISDTWRTECCHCIAGCIENTLQVGDEWSFFSNEQERPNYLWN